MKLLMPSVLAALSLAACSAEQSGADNAAMSTANEHQSNETAAQAPAPKSPDQTFVDHTAAGNSYEVAAGKTAVEKATTPALKKYAQMLIDDHTRSTIELKMASAKAGLMPNPSLSAEQRANLDTLGSASGKAFDQAFVSQQLASHPKMLDEQNDYVAHGKHAELRNFAKGNAPWVLRHLRLGKEL